ncbi:MAG: pyridoxal phosphate-dependent aminotransferase [Methanobacteriota archaeon]
MHHRLDDPRLAARVNLFPESVIREMTRLAMQHDAVNLGQGFPDFDPPREMVDAAKRALDGPHNQYSVTWGSPNLRRAIAEKVARFNRIPCDAEKNVTVTCGSTEAMMASMLSLVDSGDEVVVFEPFYENYGPDAALSGAKLRFVPLVPDRGFRFDEEALKAAFGPQTKALILNTPNNPAGKVFSKEEQKVVADLCVDHDAVAVTDEIYEHILYDGRAHVSIATLPGMLDRTITISGASKTYSATGWRVAWAVANPTLSVAIRRVHDFLTVGAPHPLQEGVAVALRFPASYYSELLAAYTKRRALLLTILREAGFHPVEPEGAYYIMADFSGVEAPAAAKADDRTFAEWLVRDVGLAGVPGGSFFSRPELGGHLIRFHFAKKDDTLEAARERLSKLS